MPDLFDATIDWLLAQALSDDDFEVTLKGLAMRLLDGGVPVARISIGREILHPVIGLIDTAWDRDSGRVQVQSVARAQISSDFLSGSPFGDLTKGKFGDPGYFTADLTDPDVIARYEIFARLASDGMTGYVAFGRRFGRTLVMLSELNEEFRGASLSFATRRFGGFSQAHLDGLTRIITALCMCIRVDNDRLLASAVLETYLGRISGAQVLTGQIARGDVRTIDCVLSYSDMRNSTGLSQKLDTEAYVACINQYFDCTAQAVLDHGGEVLKFIGDGVLAIFPVNGDSRPRASMCAAALSAAREAFARAGQVNAKRTRQGLPAFDFGVGLHVGQVIYGNVGTEKRLDFTATGTAVSVVSRCEALTRALDAPLIATADFAGFVSEPGVDLGRHDLRGITDGVALVGYPL